MKSYDSLSNNGNGVGAADGVAAQVQDAVGTGIKAGDPVVEGDEGAGLAGDPKGPGTVGGKHPMGAPRLVAPSPVTPG